MQSHHVTHRIVGLLLLASTIACGSSPTAPSAPPFTKSGTGDTVFTLPNVARVQVTGTFTGSASNFIVWIGPQNIACDLVISGDCRLLVNELIGTFYNKTSYSGTLQTGGGGAVQIVKSSGVAWTFTEVR